MPGFGDPETWAMGVPESPDYICSECGAEVASNWDLGDSETFLCGECLQINSARELKKTLRAKAKGVEKMNINSVSVFFEKEKNPKVNVSELKESVYPVSLTVKDGDFGSATHFHFCSFDQIVSFKSQLDEGIRQTLKPATKGDKIG